MPAEVSPSSLPAPISSAFTTLSSPCFLFDASYILLPCLSGEVAPCTSKKREGEKAGSLPCFSRCLSDVPHQGKGERQSAVLLLLLLLSPSIAPLSPSPSPRQPESQIYTRACTHSHACTASCVMRHGPAGEGIYQLWRKVATFHFPLLLLYMYI